MPNGRIGLLEEHWGNLMHGIRSRLQQDPAAISQSQYLVLCQLSVHSGCAVSAVAQRLDITLAATTGLIDRLVRVGWVERTRDDADRRIVRLHLTSAGSQALTEERARRRGIIDDLLGQLTETEQDRLIELFERLLLILEQSTVTPATRREGVPPA